MDAIVVLLVVVSVLVFFVAKKEFVSSSSSSGSSEVLLNQLTQQQQQLHQLQLQLQQQQSSSSSKHRSHRSSQSSSSSSSSSSSESGSNSSPSLQPQSELRDRSRRRRYRRYDDDYDYDHTNKNNGARTRYPPQQAPQPPNLNSFDYGLLPSTSSNSLSTSAGASSSSSPSSSISLLPLSNTSSSSSVVGGDRDMRQTIAMLAQRNRNLQKQLTLMEFSNVQDIDDKYRAQKLTPSEIETIRAIFNLFDRKQCGSIQVEDLKVLHLKLGEPLTDEEASSAIADLDIDNTGEITFNKFVYWWYESHKGGKRSNAYTNRFKLLHAKLSDPSFNCDKVVTQDSGTVFTLEYRMGFYYKSGSGGLKQISPWHDIPLYRIGSGSDNHGQLYNMIVEIPKWTRAKFEVATGEPFNPIKQDTKNGALRYYKHGDMMFNYGLLPQTWEDPSYSPSDTKCPGDNDPIDAIEIGCRQLKTGTVVGIKLLGLLGLIDDGETDWKCIVINIEDPLAAQLNDIDDVDTHLPGAIIAIREYFRDYKNYAGGKQNFYALREQAMPRDYAVKIVEQTHHHWMALHLERKQHTVCKDSASSSSTSSSSSTASPHFKSTRLDIASSSSSSVPAAAEAALNLIREKSVGTGSFHTTYPTATSPTASAK